MDVMLLVVDVTKGMQAQTTECVVIGEAVMVKGASVIVVLNKVIQGQGYAAVGSLRTRICHIILYSSTSTSRLSY